MRWIGCLIGLLMATCAVPGPAATPSEGVATASGEPLPVLRVMDPAEDRIASAFHADGTRAALATRAPQRAGRTVLRIVSTTGRPAGPFELSGFVRDLHFTDDTGTLYGLLHHPAKRGEGQTELIRLDPESGKLTRTLSLPPSATALAAWPEQDAVLVACHDEIRTVLHPQLRSGVLYPVPGNNLSITSVGGSRVLIGQEDKLLLIDLADPPGRYEMPVRDRIELSEPLVALAWAANGAGALARRADGRTYTVRSEPLRLEDRGSTWAIATGPLPRGFEPIASTPPPPPPARPESRPAPAPVAVETPFLPVESEPDPTPPVAPTKPAPPPSATHQLEGTVSGPAVDQVVAVVLLGPNNILREAARVSPDADGHWIIDGLAPGRYRVQVDGGGTRVLVSEPRFLVIDVVSGEHVQAPSLRVLRAL